MLNVLFDFISLYLFVLTFKMKIKDGSYRNHWNTLVFNHQWEIMSDLNMSHGRYLIFFISIWFHFSHKTENLWLWKSLKYFIIFFDKIMCDSKYVQWKIGWFCFISTVWIHFSHKTDKIWFWKSLKHFKKF